MKSLNQLQSTTNSILLDVVFDTLTMDSLEPLSLEFLRSYRDMPNRKPHTKSRRHFDDSSLPEVTITPIRQGLGNPDFLEIETPFHPGFVTDIKKIPWKERYWEPTRKVWGVHVKHQALLLSIVGKVWHGDAKITFQPVVNPNSILSQQKALVNKAMQEFKDDNLDSLKLT